MAGKLYKGKTCVYCCVEGASDTGDHVFPRELFLKDRRDNLPQVPACNKCNGNKSKLEHYLTAVLPFGGRHDDALPNLGNMVPLRLKNNQKLHRQIAAGVTRELLSHPSGLLIPTTAIPFDAEKLEKLFVFVVKGLMWHHWNVLLGSDCGVQVSIPGAMQKPFYEKLFQHRAKARLDEDLGNGTVKYVSAQGIDKPIISVWKFSLYGAYTWRMPPLFPAKSYRQFTL